MATTNLLEEKQLDFNQPLLSVRKCAAEFPNRERESTREAEPAILVPPPPPPPHKRELKSGPLSNPGTVPFVWEQSPGRPKDGTAPEYQFLQNPRAGSKPPPGKRSNNMTDEGCRMAESLVSDPDTDIFVDAQATPSRSDSFFLNCSISGLSELDGAEAEPLGVSTMDLQTRDFMIGRFLPAAEAMASENPQFSSRKQLVPRKQFSFISDTEADDPPSLTSPTDRQSPLPHNDSRNRNVHGLEVESDDEEDALDNPSSKACGLLPRFCFQNSIHLVNHVPGMKNISLVRTTKRSSNDLKQTKDRLRKRLDGIVPYRRASNQSSELEKTERPGVCEDFNVSERNESGSCRDSVTSFRDLLAMEKLEWELDSANSVIEKTVYVDSVNSVELQSSGSVSTDTCLDQGEIRAAVSIDSSVDSSPPIVKQLSSEDTELCKSSDSGVSCAQSVSEANESQQVVKSGEQTEAENKLSSEVGPNPLLPPPAPKSPSESWLQKTLPAVSLKTSSSRGLVRNPVIRPSQ